jgi:hypothetical protein
MGTIEKDRILQMRGEDLHDSVDQETGRRADRA